MYGETGDLMRTELAALLRQHRILHRLGEHPPSAPDAVPEREAAGIVIGQYRQTVLSWCAEAVMAAKPLVFSATLPAPANPFRTSADRGTAVSELARALGRAREASRTPPASTALLGTAHPNEVVEHWRHAARAAALAEHDTNGVAGLRLTGPQAQAVVGDVAAVTQALVVLDQRYLNVPGWERLTEPGRLGWTALATALDVGLGQPDYSVDDTGWRPRTHALRIGPQRGILGVLQSEHDLLVHLRPFPTAMNLRLIVDSQQRLSRRLAILAQRTDARRAETWRARAAAYSVLKQQLRNVGGRIGRGGPAVADAANATARLRALPAQTIVEPRVAAGFQTLFNGIDQRIAEIIETGIDQKTYLQRVQLPRLVPDSAGLVAPVRERFTPIDRSANKELVRAVHGLVPHIEPEPATPGRSRSALHSALIHHPAGRRTDPGLPGP
ncbi:hypothetical protein [Nocardioides terrisoli]|uniref:hypothetical protein n=1 Tax=Nocardioides terrisoli TaxID=3388267 RepID=UPI00287B91AF|nr:hypothetical protein [Nocardioides marmorisolisilvae]